MKKLIYSILIVLLITGCSTTVDNKETQTKIVNAIAETKKEMNYTLENEYSQINEVGGEKVIVDSTEIISLNNDEGENEIAVEVLGSYDLQDSEPEVVANSLWYKEGRLYLMDNQKRYREVDYDEFSNLYLNSQLDGVLNEVEFSKASEKEENGLIVYDLTLTDSYKKKLGNAISEGAEVTSASFFIQIKEDKMVARGFTLECKISEENITFSTTYTQTWTLFNETSVIYPDDLDSYVDVTNTTTNDSSGVTINLEDILIKEFNYQKQDDGTLMYDWGTEKYIFDFTQKNFTLETETHTFDYNWGSDIGSIQNSACTYDFTAEKAANCTDEEIENIILAKEVFVQELNYSGVSLESLQ